MTRGIGFPRLRVLPLTIAALGLLLTLKAVGLLQAVIAGSAVAAEAPTAPAAALPPAAAGGPSAAPLPATPPMTAPLPSTQSTPLASATAGPPPALNAAAAPPPPVSDAERGLLLDLRHRRDLLDTRTHSLDQRDAVMQAAEQKLGARVAELNALQTKLETLEAARQSHDNANWASLVHIYEAMKPRDAATIFDALDMQVLLGVLDRMSERKAAPVLAAMQPERARLATQLLAELRTRAVTPAADAAVTPASLQTSDKPVPQAPEPRG